MSEDLVAEHNADSVASLNAAGDTPGSSDMPPNQHPVAQRQAEVFRDPGNASAWRAFGRALHALNRRSAAGAAFARSLTVSVNDAELSQIEQLIRSGKFAQASALLERRLAADDWDLVALRLAGDLEIQRRNLVAAEHFYRRCIELCPSYVAARHALSRLLLRQARLGEASLETERMLAGAPFDPKVRTLKAAVAASIGDHADAACLYQGLASELPGQPSLWLGLGHCQRTLGAGEQAVAAYRRAAELPSGAAEAYWSLSNLKTFRFDDADLARMEQLADDASGLAAAHLHFALGLAYDQRDQADRAFDHFRAGNSAKRAMISYDANRASDRLQRWSRSVSAAQIEARAGEGHDAGDPIFIVGLPRSGSTLIEQILGSHSKIEATAELPYLDRIASRLARRGLPPRQERAELVLDDVDLAELGREYLSAARVHRKTDKPLFIDKSPGNFAHAALLKLMLPNAKIIDVRRRPLATTWSVFKQLFSHGQLFAYELTEIVRWYQDYAAAMAHFDTLMPGHVTRVDYEKLVDDPEAQIGRLLTQLGLSFEPACLRFYESGNAVRTPSSEQVRRPISRDGIDDWRRYETYLAPAASMFEIFPISRATKSDTAYL